MKKILPFLLLFAIVLLPEFVEAQCSMCKAVLESNMQSGEESVGKGINSGIIYIMFIPYILLGVVGFFMYKHYIKPSNSN